MTPSVEEKTIVVNELLANAYSARTNNLRHSVELAEKALSLSREIHDVQLEGRSLNQLSLYFMIMGEYEKSTNTSKEAIRIFEELNDEKGIADAKYNIAGIYYKTDNYHLGLAYLIDCLDIYKRYDDFHNESRTEKSLGAIYEYFGDLNNAVKAYQQAIESGKKTGDPNLESNVYNNLSGIYLKQNKIEEAADLIDRSIDIKRATGDTRGLAFAIYGRGKVYTRTGRFVEAEKDFKEAIEIHKAMGEKLGLGMAYHKLGVLYVEMGRLDEAKTVINEAVAFSDKHNIVIIKFKCDYLLYRICKLENDPAGALEYLESYFKEKEAVINTQTLKVIENYELITRMKTLEKEAELQREKAEIIEKKNRAEESARVRQEFLSTMSHEIRTPLNAVITIISLLEGKNDADQKQLLDSLKFASGNLLGIINDILDFTKLDSDKTKLELRNTPFKPLLKNICGTYDSLAKQKGLKLTLKMGAGIAESYDIDETRITQILGNLLNNAIKFTDKGRIDVEVNKLSSNQQSDRLLFKVIDTGEGIPQEYFEEIFNSFSQTRPTTTRKHGGAGLGLAIVKKLVELHGGEVKVGSKLGNGSAFSFELNLTKSVAMEKAPVDYSGVLENKIALVAEDNDINAYVIRKLLSRLGVVSELAVNGVEAVELANKKSFDFILMDIHMPEMDGFNAAANIRNHDNPNTKTPIFALSADITASSQEKYVQYFNAFLWKPLQIEKLHEALITTI